MGRSRSAYRTIWQNTVNKNTSAFQTSMCNAARFAGILVPSGAEDSMTNWLNSESAKSFARNDADDLSLGPLIDMGGKIEEFWECQVKAINDICGKAACRLRWHIPKSKFVSIVGARPVVMLCRHKYDVNGNQGTWYVPSVISVSGGIVTVDDPVGNPADLYETVGGKQNDGYGLTFLFDKWWEDIAGDNGGCHTVAIFDSDFEDPPDTEDLIPPVLMLPGVFQNAKKMYEDYWNEEQLMAGEVKKIGQRGGSMTGVIKEEAELQDRVTESSMAPMYLQFVNQLLGNMYFDLASPPVPAPPFELKP